MIIWDDHFHVDPYHGLFLEAVKEFHKAGGTHLVVVYKTAHDYGFPGLKAEDFMKAMDFHMELVEKINRETPVKAYAVVGVHPAEFDYLAREKGLEYAKGEVMKALDYAQRLCLEGKAIGIGEIGRPHYPVPEDIWEASIELMKYGMSLAKEADCAVQLHTESFDEAKFRELGKYVKEVGIKPYKVVKHFSPPLVKVAEEVGVFHNGFANGQSDPHSNLDSRIGRIEIRQLALNCQRAVRAALGAGGSNHESVPERLDLCAIVGIHLTSHEGVMGSQH